MAAPRVFISSTFYDLQHVRNDIEGFLKNMGYDPIMHERGSVQYSQTETLERSCYEEVSHSDIVVCIIGGKYGTNSLENNWSITMGELEQALSDGKLLYVFIDRNVDAENKTYLANEGKIKPYHADNIKIHEYIDKLRKKCVNHPIETFESSLDIVDHLKKQLAGKFQQLLQRESNSSSSGMAASITSSTESLKSTIDDIEIRWNTMIDRLQSSSYSLIGPVFFIKRLLGITAYDIYLNNYSSLCTFLRDIRFNVEFESDGSTICTIKAKRYYSTEKSEFLTIDKQIFEDDGQIRDIRKIKDIESLISYNLEYDDELPF